MYASRNIRLCNKDCVCLFVCPTGATDTEDGQIDRDACLDGCRLCVDACPSHAIYLVVDNYNVRPPKAANLAESMMKLCARKSQQELLALAISDADSGANPGAARVARAIAKSARILAEDCAREAGYLIPQSHATQELLAGLDAT
jgi:Fe-S-cluster-containing hydrogenase component 2